MRCVRGGSNDANGGDGLDLLRCTPVKMVNESGSNVLVMVVLVTLMMGEASFLALVVMACKFLCQSCWYIKLCY